nr:immunoglobulin heavy chain junction region [Macaca mulatta]
CARGRTTSPFDYW